MKKFKLLLLSLSFTSTVIMAHEGHDHDAPTKVSAPKGGTIKQLENTYVEVVSKQKDIKVYLYDKELKPKKTTDFKITLKAEIPRTKKVEPITFTTTETLFEATYDAKNLHRYTLLIEIVDPATGHTDQLKFIIEPRK